MRASRPSIVVSAVVLVSGCTAPKPLLTPDPHYVLGHAYQAGAVWLYPREAFDLNETGIAAVTTNDAARLTTDGEVFDQTALAGGHPTLQLPAIARVTNLENGRAVVIRLNDRGHGDPHRLLELTRRTARLLAVPDNGVARVRLAVLQVESHAAADTLPGAPSLAIAAAPRDRFEVAELAPLPGVRQAHGVVPAMPVASKTMEATEAPPLRMPEVVSQTVPRPGRLMVVLDTFEDYRYAAEQRTRLAAAGARVVTVTDGRTRRFRVEVGPLADVAQADRILDQALASGIPDARIVVD